MGLGLGLGLGVRVRVIDGAADVDVERVGDVVVHIDDARIHLITLLARVAALVRG